MPEFRIIERSRDSRFILAGNRDGYFPVFARHSIASPGTCAGGARIVSPDCAEGVPSATVEKRRTSLTGTRSSCPHVTGFLTIDPAPRRDPSAEAHPHRPIDMLNNLHELPLKLPIDFQFDPQCWSLKSQIVRSSKGGR